MKPWGGGTGTNRLKGLALGILAAVRLAAAEALLLARCCWFYIPPAPTTGWILGGFINDCLLRPCGIYFEFKLPGLFI